MNSIFTKQNNAAWPQLEYESFKDTAYVVHRVTQMMGKLKLCSPFEPHWANVALWFMSRGLTTGAIPYEHGSFTVTYDLIDHTLVFTNNWGKSSVLALKPSSIASLYQAFQEHLSKIDVKIPLNPKPQEIPNAIAFDLDKQARPYDTALVNAWWGAVLSSYQVLMQYHALFLGISPAPGFMWGTFDLRDARYTNKIVAPPVSKYIERNAMDVEQVEAGFWSGNELYPKPAYYSFTYPKPKGIENTKVKPEAAHWNDSLGEFILDYEVVRTSQNPAQTLRDFFDSCYQAGSELAGWDPKLITIGKPI
jgi:hypothetical protein